MKVMIFDVGGTEIKYSVMDEQMHRTNSGAVPTPQDTQAQFLDTIYRLYAPHKGEVVGIAMALPGWSLGTYFGVVMGNVLPANIVSALSVGLYGMFLAIIIPPARENRVIAALVVISMLASCAFAYLPVVSAISPGTRVIILTVAISAVAAALFPVKEEDGHAA